MSTTSLFVKVILLLLTPQPHSIDKHPIFTFSESPCYSVFAKIKCTITNAQGSQFLYAHGKDGDAASLYTSMLFLVALFGWAVHMNHLCGRHTDPSLIPVKLTELGVAPSFFNKVQSIMSQKYSGDITIIPDIGYGDFLKVLSNPTDESVIEAIIRGEQATWPSKYKPPSFLDTPPHILV